MAITTTITSTKISVSSTGGQQVSMSDIVAHINDTSVMEEIEKVITIKRQIGQIYRKFEVASESKVIYEEGYTINQEGITNSGSYYILDWQDKSEITIEPDVIFDFNSDNQDYGRAYIIIYGTILARGNLNHEIIFKHYRSLYNYPKRNQSWEHVKFMNFTYNGYALHVAGDSYSDIKPTVLYDYITVTNDNGNYWGTLYLHQSATMPLDNVQFNNFKIEHIYYPLRSNQGSVKITNSSFLDCSRSITLASTGLGEGIPYLVGGSEIHNNKTFQPISIFDTCVFDDIAYGYCLWGSYAGKILLKNCTFKNTLYAVRSYLGCMIIFSGVNTFINITNKFYPAGNYFIAHHLDLNVIDEGGLKIEHASISIVQQSINSKSWEVGLTNIDGQLVNVWNDLPFFIEKQETFIGVFDSWSDDESSNLYHKITVSKDGYITQNINVEFIENKTISIVLEKYREHIQIDQEGLA